MELRNGLEWDKKKGEVEARRDVSEIAMWRNTDTLWQVATGEAGTRKQGRG
jgi:hypothetical protein